MPQLWRFTNGPHLIVDADGTGKTVDVGDVTTLCEQHIESKREYIEPYEGDPGPALPGFDQLTPQTESAAEDGGDNGE